MRKKNDYARMRKVMEYALEVMKTGEIHTTGRYCGCRNVNYKFLFEEKSE